MLAALLILGAVASAQKDDFGFGGGAPRRPPPPSNADKPKPLWFVPSGPATKENCNAEGEAVLSGAKEVFESPTSEIFVPEGKGTDICIFFAPPQPQVWQLGAGVSYNSKSCSEGCCFYTPASSSRVQEIEAEVEKNLPTWFRTPAGGCDAVPKTTFNSRLVLNKDNNVSSAQLLHIFCTHPNQTKNVIFIKTLTSGFWQRVSAVREVQRLRDLRASDWGDDQLQGEVLCLQLQVLRGARKLDTACKVDVKPLAKFIINIQPLF